jgi:hypothetical protein
LPRSIAINAVGFTASWVIARQLAPALLDPSEYIANDEFANVRSKWPQRHCPVPPRTETTRLTVLITKRTSCVCKRLLAIGPISGKVGFARASHCVSHGLHNFLRNVAELGFRGRDRLRRRLSVISRCSRLICRWSGRSLTIEPGVNSDL